MVESIIARALNAGDRDIVAAFARHHDVAWRVIVAGIDDLPAWVLEVMVSDHDGRARAAVAAHPAATETVHALLIDAAERRPSGDTDVLKAITAPTA